MELQGIGWNFKLPSRVYLTGNDYGSSSVCMVLQNPCLVHKRAVICILKYLMSTSTYVDLLYRNRQLSAHEVVHRLDK